MKYLVVFLLFCASAAATVPTKIEWAGMPLLAPGASQVQARCPRAAAANDTIIVVGDLGSNTISSITDDNGTNTWVQDVTVAGRQFGFIYRASSVKAGTRVVTITLSATTTNTMAQCFLFNNLAASPVDVSCGQDDSVSGTSHACGSMTTGTSGDEILMCSFMDMLASGQPPTWTAGTGFTLAAVHNFDGQACQFENQSSASAVNPTLTSSNSQGTLNIGIAYKTGANGGSAPTTVYVPHIQIYNFSEWAEQGGALTGTSFTLNFPCSSAAKGLDIAYESNGITVSSFSSSPSNTWTGTTAATSGSEVLGHETATVSNCGSTFTITFGLSGTPDDTTNAFQVVASEIQNTAGLDGGPCNTTGTDNNTTFPRSDADNSCTTAQANEAIIAFRQNAGQTVTSSSVNNSGTDDDLQPDSGGTYASFSGNEDAGEAVIYAPTAGAYTQTWTYSNYEGSGCGGVCAVGNFLTQAMRWESPAVAANAPTQIGGFLVGP